MGRARFDNARFLGAARDIAHEIGPAGVTVGSVTQRLGAPTGSFYYRFPSRDLLLGELWLATALAFQEDFVAAIETGHGLAAALHTPVWVRAHLDDARLLLLYHRDDFVQGEWPEALKRGVALQAQRVDDCYEKFARDTFGEANPEQLRIAQFVLADVPKAAVIPHLRRREPPPPVVDELIRLSYRAIVQGRHATNRRNRAGKRRRTI
jgi:AcrR family transcriptional regulator